MQPPLNSNGGRQRSRWAFSAACWVGDRPGQPQVVAEEGQSPGEDEAGGDPAEDGAEETGERDAQLEERVRQDDPEREGEGGPEADLHGDRHHALRLRRGSRASRRESPKRLNPNTARLIATPGKRAIHGAFSA